MGQRGQYNMRSGPPKKDRQSVGGVTREIGEETRIGSSAPVLQLNRNRDAARGDSDRTNRRFDEGNSRDDQSEMEPEPDEPLTEPKTE
jgi:hypothetical protein